MAVKRKTAAKEVAPDTATSAPQRLVEYLRGKYGGEAAALGSARSSVKGVVPFGVDVIDNYVLGCGGIPLGRFGELFSEEGGGKTSLGWMLLASAQSMGGTAVLLETEHGFDKARAEFFGVVPDELLVSSPSSVEDALEYMSDILGQLSPDDGPTVVVWDSLAASPTKRELDEGIGGTAKIADRAQAMSRAMRLLPEIATKSGAAIVVINQIRDTPGAVFGPGYSTPGGRALKFHASWRLRLMGGTTLKEGDRKIGKDILVECVKNRFAPPLRVARVRLRYDTGFDNQWSTINFAKDYGLLNAGARWTDANFAEAVRLLTECGWCPEKRVKPLPAEATDE